MDRILIVGLGSIGQRHMRNLARRHPDAEFTVLRHRAGSHPLIKELNATVETSLDDVLQTEFDLAVVSSPSANHMDVLPKLIARGIDLLVEKPIVTSLQDCDTLIALLATAPKATRVSGFNFRHLPSLKQAKEKIASGALGNIVRASFSAGLWLPDWRPQQDYREGYSADASRGGGVEMDLVHELDVARWFFGDINLTYAMGGHLSSLDMKAHDTSAMLLRGDQGPFVHVSLDFVSRTRMRHYEVIGDKGGLVWSLDGFLHALTPTGRTIITDKSDDFDVPQTYVSMIDDLVQNAPSLQSLEDGIASSRLAIMARDFGSHAPST